jgi:hypothetical protein
MKFTIVCVIVFSVCVFSEFAAAGTVMIGTFNSGACLPSHCNDSGTSSGQTIDYQQVASCSLFSGPVTITSYTTYFDQQLRGSSRELSGEYDVYIGYSARPVGGLSTRLADNVEGTLTPFTVVRFGGFVDNPRLTTIGIPFHYDPSLGNLLIEVRAIGQPIVSSKSEGGLLEADNTGSVISRAYCITNVGCFADNTGIVTTVNYQSPAPTQPDSSDSSNTNEVFGRRPACIRPDV